jgi:hypothetical protein
LSSASSQKKFAKIWLISAGLGGAVIRVVCGVVVGGMTGELGPAIGRARGWWRLGIRRRYPAIRLGWLNLAPGFSDGRNDLVTFPVSRVPGEVLDINHQ